MYYGVMVAHMRLRTSLSPTPVCNACETCQITERRNLKILLLVTDLECRTLALTTDAEAKLWLSLSAKQCRNLCPGPPHACIPVFEYVP